MKSTNATSLSLTVESRESTSADDPSAVFAIEAKRNNGVARGGIQMFQKACLVLIIVLLTAILMSQRSQQGAHAQAGPEYKVVNAEIYLGPDGKEAFAGENLKYYSTQDALNQYGKNGWELVTAFYDFHFQSNTRELHLIFMKR